MDPSRHANDDAIEILFAVQNFFSRQRQSILANGTAESKATDGAVPSNPLGERMADGQRAVLLNGSSIRVNNVTKQDFALHIKHPAFFTACLGILSRHYPCFAIVRNPLSVLLSWRDAGSMPIARGHAPMAEHFDLLLARSLAHERDVLERQFILLDWYFAQYAHHIADHVIKYEHIVQTGGKALSAINDQAEALNERLSTRNTLALEHDPQAQAIANKLLSCRENACWQFYQSRDVEALFQ
jgi:hypothetical protein